LHLINCNKKLKLTQTQAKPRQSFSRATEQIMMLPMIMMIMMIILMLMIIIV